MKYNQNMMIYMPKESELTNACNLLQLNEAMTYKAKHIIKGRFLDLDQNGNAIAISSSNETKTYRITNLKECECPAFQHSPKKIRCKHIEALRVYRSIMRKHLNNRIHGSFKFKSDQIHNRHHFNTYLLIDQNKTLSYIQSKDRIPTHVCNIRVRKHNFYDFSNNQNMFAFSIWLNKARTQNLVDQEPHKQETGIFYDEVGEVISPTESSGWENEQVEYEHFDDYIYR